MPAEDTQSNKLRDSDYPPSEFICGILDNQKSYHCSSICSGIHPVNTLDHDGIRLTQAAMNQSHTHRRSTDEFLSANTCIAQEGRQ